MEKMKDTIYRQDAINAVHKAGITEYDETLAIEEIEKVLPAQQEPAIPLQWIEARIEWLKSLDNTFSTLTAVQISAMVNKWKEEQDETD